MFQSDSGPHSQTTLDSFKAIFLMTDIRLAVPIITTMILFRFYCALLKVSKGERMHHAKSNDVEV
jgi:hypothetical protein